jgi:phospholipid/cholesterol/gamma-HCH transport system substrate-binding protein
MHMSRRIWIQLIVFIVVAVIAAAIMLFGYMKVPRMLGVGYYDVRLELQTTGGLYERANVTYRGTEVGQVTSVHLTDAGVEATLKLKSDIEIPSDVDAEVHSVSAVGEQYVSLIPRDAGSPPLEAGDVIVRDRTSVPPAIDSLLDATNRGLQAIPHDNLKTTIDEAYVAFGGLGPEISRIVKGATALATDARENLGELTNVVDNSKPILDSQTDSSNSIQAWAANLSRITQQLEDNDSAVRGVLQNGPAAIGEARDLLDRLQPTLPVVLANLVGLGEVAVTYRDNLEQILVLLPQGVELMQGTLVPNQNTKDYNGIYLSFNLNLNVPPPCTTGFLPIQQMRVPTDMDYPTRPDGQLYCRVPQDSPFNVRAARNTPCVRVPGKRAPTVKMCESDEEYVPLNDGFNWKGDPNATLSGQDIPQLAADVPEAPPAPAPPPMAVAEYDPSTGTYVGPDGQIYTQSNLARGATGEQTWQSMLIPPKPN